MLFDKKDVNNQAKILNDTITNNFFNFVPNNILTFDDRDPQLMNELIKSKLKRKMVFVKIIRVVLGVLLILRYYKMQYQSYHS